jgi:sulfate/thiosulfate transport system substrate-binding protein
MPRWFRSRPGRLVPAFTLTLALAATACSTASGASSTGADGACTPSETPVVTLAAYSNPYVAYGKLISTWQTEWKDAHDGQLVQFLTSFGGSTTQAQSIVNGLQADIYASSLAPDVQMVEDAGLITNDWQNATDESIVQSGSVVFAVRPGNPNQIDNWDDLTQPGLEILTPDPAQSGGARWNIVAAYGASMRGEVPGYAKDDPADAERLLEGIFANVTVMDKSANDSLKNFEAGNGDVAITYDYQVATAQAAGGLEELVEPPSTVSIRTPTVVVDKNAEAHCVEDIANEFVEYLHSDEAQEIFASTAYTRPIDVTEAAKATDYLPAVEDLFTTDDLGGWDELVNDTVFGPDGAFTKAFAAVKG